MKRRWHVKRRWMAGLLGLAIAVAAVSWSAPTVHADAYPFGDVNQGTRTTNQDAQEIATYLKGTLNFSTEQKTAADVNLDGTIAITDCLLILGYVSNDYRVLGAGRMIALSSAAVTLSVGEQTNLNVLIATNHPDVSWSSSDTKIATVSATGLATARREGSCTIKATLSNTKVTLLFDITVKKSSIYRGVDVSEFQGNINWSQVKKSGEVDFAILRVGFGYGTTVTKDSKYTSYYKGASDQKIPLGAYLYCAPYTVEESKIQAKWMLDATKDNQLSYPLVMDLEDDSLKKLSKAQLTAIANAFLETIQAGGRYPMLYTYLDFANSYLDMKALAKWDVWIADYNDTAPRTDFTYQMWQYTDNGTVAGIPNRVDKDISYADFPAIIQSKA